MMEPLSLNVERSVLATPLQVFDAWTDPAELANWWTPPGGRCVSASIDLRVGGRYAIVNELPDGTIISIRGEYLTIKRPSMLRFTWATNESQAATETVTVTFEADGQQTKVGVAHARMSSQEVADSHASGWASCLKGLADYVGHPPLQRAER